MLIGNIHVVMGVKCALHSGYWITSHLCVERLFYTTYFYPSANIKWKNALNSQKIFIVKCFRMHFSRNFAPAKILWFTILCFITSAVDRKDWSCHKPWWPDSLHWRHTQEERDTRLWGYPWSYHCSLRQVHCSSPKSKTLLNQNHCK